MYCFFLFRRRWCFGTVPWIYDTGQCVAAFEEMSEGGWWNINCLHPYDSQSMQEISPFRFTF